MKNGQSEKAEDKYFITKLSFPDRQYVVLIKPLALKCANTGFIIFVKTLG